LAYRAHGLSATPRNWLRVTGIERKDFAPFWSRRGSDPPLSDAARFVRDPRLAPELPLVLRPLAPQIRGEQTVHLNVVGPTQAELHVVAKLEAPGKEISLVEWDIQSARPLVISGVTGADVLRWSQSGNRLLVWLAKTAAATNVELTGWLPLVAPAQAGKPAKGDAASRLPRLELPCLRLAEPGTCTTKLLLTPA